MIEITVKPGSSIEDCCRRAHEEASRICGPVKMTFNGTTINVDPGLNEWEVHTLWVQKRLAEAEARCDSGHNLLATKQVLTACKGFFESVTMLRAYQGSDERFIRKIRGHYLSAFIDLISLEHPDWSPEQIIAFLHGTEFDSPGTHSIGEDAEWLAIEEEIKEAVERAVDFHRLSWQQFREKWPDAVSELPNEKEAWIEPMKEALELHHGMPF